MFTSSPEYIARTKRPFRPPQVTLKQIHDAVPKTLLRKDPVISASYVVRDVLICTLLFKFAGQIPFFVNAICGKDRILPQDFESVAKGLLWLWYWWWQGLVFTSFFCIAHELGHHALFDDWYANNIFGYLLDTFILVPFFAWKASHNAHHKAAGSIERDENYVPYERRQLGLPPPERTSHFDYMEVFDETPLFTLGRMIVMQACGWWLYLGCNAMGSPSYPEGTNHFSPNSPLFRAEQRKGIIISDVGLACMMGILGYAAKLYGYQTVLLTYFAPYFICNHWIVLCTFLHHSDPTIPHYRNKEWSFLRGAAATVDRPILGWIGRFFFHNVSHDHVAHHFFSNAPFYNQPQITEAIKKVLQEDYNYDSTNTLYALYRSFTQCVFVENEGDIVFYKNNQGEAQRILADDLKDRLEQEQVCI